MLQSSLIFGAFPSGLPKGLITRVACFDDWHAGNVWPSGLCSNKNKTGKSEPISGVTILGYVLGRGATLLQYGEPRETNNKTISELDGGFISPSLAGEERQRWTC